MRKDEARRHEFVTSNIFRELPLKAIDISSIFDEVNFRFRRPSTAVSNLSDPWYSSCQVSIMFIFLIISRNLKLLQHEREGELEEGNDQNWVTAFSRNDCAVCYGRFERQLVRSLDCTVPVLFTLAGECCVEFRCVDEDSVSERVYRFWCELVPGERKKYGGAV
jgi:hypothetical protein